MALASTRDRLRPAISGARADLAVAVLLAAIAAVDAAFSGDRLGPLVPTVVVNVGAALALSWRRTRPLTALAIVMGCFAVLGFAYGSSESWSGVFLFVIAVYSAAVYGSSVWVTAGLAMGGVAVISVTDPQIDSLTAALWTPSLAVLTIGVGLTGRAFRSRAGALDERADDLDREEQRRAAEAAAEERRRIARELHDIISHSLGVIVLQAGAAQRVLARDPERAGAVLESIRVTGQGAIGEMGTLLGLLDGAPQRVDGPQPSLADLDALVSRMRDAGVDVDLVIEGRKRTLPTALELSAFRVVQEGLTNAVKHAGAAHVDVRVTYAGDELQVEVADDGAGHANGSGGRRGLAGIDERVGVFGGQLAAGPRPEGGWTLHVTFPIAR